MEFWFPLNEVPSNDLLNMKRSVNDKCVKIIIPDVCPDPKCNVKFILGAMGDNLNNSYFDMSGYCMHYFYWPDIWSKKLTIASSVQNTTKGIPIIGTIGNMPLTPTMVYKISSNKDYTLDLRLKNTHTDPTKDGMKCSGSCGSWVPMAAPNDDGSFVCYSCRTGF
jgi:hypothetical protein